MKSRLEKHTCIDFNMFYKINYRKLHVYRNLKSGSKTFSLPNYIMTYKFKFDVYIQLVIAETIFYISKLELYTFK